MFALDTNTLIYYFKGMGRVAEHLLATPPSKVVIPTVVVYELEVGIAKSSSPAKRRAQLAEMLQVARLAPFDQAAAEQSAGVRAALEAVGTPIGPIDTLIAGTALALRATLVSRNLGELTRVPGLEVVDWF